LKRAFSILFLIIFLFNVGGYYLVFWVLRHQANLELSARVEEKSFSKEETIEIRIPLNLPYPLHARGFERLDRQFEYKGEYYKLVKHELDNNTLIVVCIKNVQEKHLVKTMNDYANLANDLPGTAKKAMNFLGKLLKDYQTGKSIEVSQNLALQYHITFIDLDTSILTMPSSIPSPPPKV
jgi:hypothetical protein